MKNFKEWFSEAIVNTSKVGEAMKKTLEFNVDCEWIKLDLQQKGWITDKGVKDSFDLSGAFYNQKIPKPAFFFLRSFSILHDSSKEYDSIKGIDGLKIKSTLFLFSGKSGLVPPGGVPGAGEPKSLKGLLEKYGSVKLSERDDSINHKGAVEKFDGPCLKTPLELATWINNVISHTDLDDIGDNEDGDDPDTNPFINPTEKSLIGQR